MCRPARKDARGRTKRLPQRGGQNAVRPDTLIPRPRLSTKPGQAHFAFRESFYDAWYLSFVIPGECGDPALFRTRRLSHLSGHWSCCELHCQVDETEPRNLPSINSRRAQIAFEPLSECPLIP